MFEILEQDLFQSICINLRYYVFGLPPWNGQHRWFDRGNLFKGSDLICEPGAQGRAL